MNCEALGSAGEHSEVTDHIDIINLRRLGFPEHQLVDDVIETANKLSELEDEFRRTFFDLNQFLDLVKSNQVQRLRKAYWISPNLPTQRFNQHKTYNLVAQNV